MRAAPKARAGDSGPADVRSEVDEIAARADTADADTLRRDVKRLAGIVRGLVR